MNIKELKKEVYQLHNVLHNQKYAEIFPYSYHIELVLKQFITFKHLLPVISQVCVESSIILHDTIEDLDLNYNDLKKLLAKHNYNKEQQELIAEIVYCVTDEKGRTRAERKNDKFYSELKQNDYAVFVKLCDMAANTLFSKASESGMYEKYKKEFPKFKEKVYSGRWDPLFEFVESI